MRQNFKKGYRSHQVWDHLQNLIIFVLSTKANSFLNFNEHLSATFTEMPLTLKDRQTYK